MECRAEDVSEALGVAEVLLDTRGTQTELRTFLRRWVWPRRSLWC